MLSQATVGIGTGIITAIITVGGLTMSAGQFIAITNEKLSVLESGTQDRWTKSDHNLFNEGLQKQLNIQFKSSDEKFEDIKRIQIRQENKIDRLLFLAQEP